MTSKQKSDIIRAILNAEKEQIDVMENTESTQIDKSLANIKFEVIADIYCRVAEIINSIPTKENEDVK